ncbi:MAG: PQQ-binding-like beta-propeller repeat protein [Xanthomonadales bacterium]|nr:PQQ-binding-like beta-propeller repeat protein [Xanthomonadales bacterium]
MALAAVAVVLVVGVVTAPDRDADQPAPVASELVQDVVVPPVTLPAPPRIHPQFSAEGEVVWERTDLPQQASDERGLAAAGDVVVLLAAGEPVLAVDVASGQDADAPPAVDATATTEPDEPTFPTGGRTMTVEVVEERLRGTVDDAEAWRFLLPAPLAAPLVRSGPTLVVALTDGTVAAIDPVRGEARWQRDLEVVPTAVAGDGTLLLVGTADGRVLRLDPEGRVVTTSQVGGGAVVALVADRPAVVLLADRLVGLDLTR